MGAATSESRFTSRARDDSRRIDRPRPCTPEESHIGGDQEMAGTNTLHDAFIDELRDVYDAERQLAKALPKMAKAATSSDLRQAFESHLQETLGHSARLEQVFQSLDEKASGKHCDGIA